MTESSKVVRNAIKPLADQNAAPHQLIYADQLSAMAVGAFTSRFTIAIENHTTVERIPVATIVMPTQALHQLAIQILAELESETTQVSLKAAYALYGQGLKPLESEQTTEGGA